MEKVGTLQTRFELSSINYRSVEFKTAIYLEKKSVAGQTRGSGRSTL